MSGKTRRTRGLSSPGVAMSFTTDSSGAVQSVSFHGYIVEVEHEEVAKTIPCPHCKEKFATDAALSDHISINHSKPIKKSREWKEGEKYLARKRREEKRGDRVERTAANRAQLREVVSCPQCGKSVKGVGLAQHQRDKHGFAVASTRASHESKSSTEGWTRCHICNVRLKNLKRHLRRVHGTSGQIDSRSSGNKAGASTSRRKSRTLDTEKKIQLEALRQSHDEPRDGSKNWGFIRRENGRFGSHPIFDDYGEESEP